MNETLIAIVVAVILGSIKLAWSAFTKRKQVQDGDGSGKLEAKLRDKLKKNGWLVLICLLFASGCSTTAVFVPDGQAVRLNKKVSNHPVSVLVDGQEIKTRMDIPAGYYCLSK